MQGIAESVTRTTDNIASNGEKLARMDEVQRELVTTSRATATASQAVAGFAEAREKREAAAALSAEKAAQAQQDIDNATSANRWRFVTENWKYAIIGVLAFAGVNIQPILGLLFGASPQVAQIAPTSPEPVLEPATPAPSTTPVPAPELP